MKNLYFQCILFLLFGLIPLSLQAQEETESDNPPTTQENSQEDTENQAETSPPEDRQEATEEEEFSAMPPQRNNKELEIPDPRQDEMETLNEVDVKEQIGPDPTRLLEDPLILRTDEDRKRQLIQKHMDLASQLLNTWTLPLLGTPLASQAEEEERLAQLEAFKERQKRDLEALKDTDKEYYRERREEYYDTVIQAQGDRWEDPSDSSF